MKIIVYSTILLGITSIISCDSTDTSNIETNISATIQKKRKKKKKKNKENKNKRCKESKNSKKKKKKGKERKPKTTTIPSLAPSISPSDYYFTDVTLRDAVKEWLDNREAALEKYGDITYWRTSRVTNMAGLFYNVYNAQYFNGDLSSWDVGAVTDMEGMFGKASSFNGDLSSWDVGAVTNMEDMFDKAFSFNGDLSSWDVGAVTNMEGMFFIAKSFNGDLSSWNVGAVTSLSLMFYGAISFYQTLCWNVTEGTLMDSYDIFTESQGGLDPDCY